MQVLEERHSHDLPSIPFHEHAIRHLLAYVDSPSYLSQSPWRRARGLREPMSQATRVRIPCRVDAEMHISMMSVTALGPGQATIANE